MQCFKLDLADAFLAKPKLVADLLHGLRLLGNSAAVEPEVVAYYELLSFVEVVFYYIVEAVMGAFYFGDVDEAGCP